MSYDLAIWKWAEGIRVVDLQGVLRAIAKDRPHASMARFDCGLVRRVFCERIGCGESDEEDSPVIWDICDYAGVAATWANLSVSWSRVEQVVAQLLRIVTEQGLVLHDYEANELLAGTHVAVTGSLGEVREDQAVAADEGLMPLGEAEIAELRRLAEAGDAAAQFNLGNCCAFGDGVAADPGEAFCWYERSARGGNSDGMFNLAACFHHGEGTARDIAQAVRWYEKAAEEDGVLAPFVLGEIYASGDGVPKDVEKAVAYYRIALQNGHPQARRALRLLGAIE